MDTKFKLKLSKLFHSSFTSCRTKHISDVTDQPFFFPENRHHRHLIDLFSPKPQSLPPPSSKPKSHFPRNPISGEITPSPAAGKPNSVFSLQENKPNPKPKPKPTKKKKTHHRKPIKIESFSSITDNYYYNCCSSDEDDEQSTLFSSRSFSSESSVSLKNRAHRRRLKGCKNQKATDVIPIKGKMVKDSVAIVKKTCDPHEDFRVSMLEMIVERQIFGVKDLENLLQCFLCLNSEEHHSVICEVFTEIWGTLFID